MERSINNPPPPPGERLIHTNENSQLFCVANTFLFVTVGYPTALDHSEKEQGGGKKMKKGFLRRPATTTRRGETSFIEGWCVQRALTAHRLLLQYIIDCVVIRH
jgi:hypothetical protein